MKYSPQDLLRFEEFLENDDDNLEDFVNDDNDEEDFLELSFSKKSNKKRDN